MKSINARESLTEREREEFEQEKEVARMQADYHIAYKQMELEVKRQEMRWTQLFRLPFAIILLPVRMLFAIAYIGHAVRGTKPDEKFWHYLTKI